MKRRQLEEVKPQSTPLWFISFADLMVVLLCFFIAIVAFSSIELKRMKGMLTGFRGAIITPFAASGGQAPDLLKKLKDQQQAEDESVETAAQIEAVGRAAGITNGLDATATPEGVRISLANPILFDEGSDQIKPAMSGFLLGLSKLILYHKPMMVVIEGHTDDTPIHTDRFPSNWELSSSRALKVLRTFQAAGIPADRLAATGYGEFRPKAPLSTSASEVDKAVNRRVEILLKLKSAPMSLFELNAPAGTTAQ